MPTNSTAADGAARGSHSGSDLLVSKAGVGGGGSGVVRHPSAPGRFQHGSIPGYTGHVQGRASEDVHGATHGRASALAVEAVLRRSSRPAHLTGYYPPHPPQGPTHAGASPEFLRGRVDGGSLNTSLASVDQGGLHVSVGISGAAAPPPECRVVSTFHNPRGHGPRSGAAVPGYAGFIPGKYAGNVFAKRYATSNVQATQGRRQASHGAEPEMTRNWIVASETDRRQNAHGATSIGEQWRFSTAPAARAASGGPLGWRLHEPASTHEWLRY